MNSDIFTQQTPKITPPTARAPWYVLLVDDEPSVHQVTHVVLKAFEFDNRPLKLISAYSGKEGREIMANRNDIALAIVDVVMESDDAGLNLVRAIRDDLHNHYTRLVLRTGQPGQAPEEDIILNYDINDYKDKTELTSSKLHTLMFASLRAYRDICVIDHHRRSIEDVILASTEIFEVHSLNTFASAVLNQICNLLHSSGAIFYCASLNEDLDESDDYQVLAASGTMQAYKTHHKNDLPSDVRHGFDHALKCKQSFIQGDVYSGYFATSLGSENILYVSLERELDDMDKQLLDIYARNVAMTYESLLLRDETLETQRELAYMLGEAVEQRSKETGSHVRRVALYSHFLALKYGIDATQAELIKLASPLHDVGKIAIPDRILKKPGKLDEQEWAIMQTHAQTGADLLSSSDNDVIKMGKIIAAQHHERWDGSGYPNQLKGNDIHIAGRITALADVFDALGSKRYYKTAWSTADVLSEINQQKGKQFDPQLVDILHENLEELMNIRALYPDM